MDLIVDTDSKRAAEKLSLCAFDVLGINEEARNASRGNVSALRKRLHAHRMNAVFFKYGVFPEMESSVELKEGCRQGAQKNVMHALRNVAFLRTLAQSFADKDIPWLLLKGDALGVQLFGDCGIRHSGDIDIWVEEARLEAVHYCLMEQGFRLEGDYFKKNKNYQNVYRRFLPHLSYSREDGTLVEVHWRMFTMPSFFKLSFEEAYRQHSLFTFQGVDVPVLDPLQNFLYLMAHGSSHFYVRIFWLLDLALYLEKHPDILNETLLGRARALGVERALAFSFVLLNHYFSVQIPEFLERSITVHRKAIDCLVQVTKTAYTDERVLASGERLHNATAFQTFKMECSLSHHWRYKIEVLFRLSLNREDFEQLSLPPSLFFIYPLIRIPLWIKRKITGGS